ncbi:DUF262 domain-containing protein [Bradyrhizobium prioriisuperbiae]|uniref:DUF262 domain-containing protein n=1 Tax=Bradyrhizobium prioriisuperbiae TaxID=2854389 RepID=UPI0028EF612E|nr:DUF262 domain-containing protein [Bradyrhizobium prioritasuperba]
MKMTPWEPDLKTVVDRINNEDIDLQPEFQRQEIWSPSKKKKLIDTIIRGWSIPPVFLVVRADGRMDVLDGQQRLAAIRDFVQNEFTIDGNITPSDPRVVALHGKYYRSLSRSDQRLLDQYTLRCFRITDYLPDEPSELFYRLNQPSMLTAGEQRNAFYGPAREQLKALVGDFEAGDNSKKTIGFSNARLAYDDIIARLLFFLEARTFAIKSTETLISQRFKERDEFSPETVSAASVSINLFSRSREQASSIRLNKASALSWLLFFARFREDPTPDFSFMSRFGGEGGLFARNYIPEAASVFQNRASLRVTDVSSVVYRDFALWYSYIYALDASLPVSVDRGACVSVHDALSQRNDATFEYAVSQLVNTEKWSRLS